MPEIISEPLLPDLEHMEYLLLQEQEPSGHWFLHPIYQKNKVRLLCNKIEIVGNVRLYVSWILHNHPEFQDTINY